MKDLLGLLDVDEATFKSLTKLNELQNFDSIKNMELLLLVEKKIGRILETDEMSRLSNRDFLESLLD
tara:strand:+ start:541 stop:741 length:201 start_codon:yes stop_codon:yes gene_type:complete